MEKGEINSGLGMIGIENLKQESLNSVYGELASLIGLESMLQVYLQFKGQQITFPVKLFSKEYIMQQIQAEYNGENVKELAKKYGYSERWIREILKQKGQ